MAVPKTAIDQNYGAVFGKDQIGLAGELFIVDAEPKAPLVQL